MTANVQALSTDIAILLLDWLNDATSSRSSRSEFPVGPIIRLVDSLLKETAPSNTECRKALEEIKLRLQKEL
jgi:nuclear pore complex protein Nup155